jgi:hypothetical protein
MSMPAASPKPPAGPLPVMPAMPARLSNSSLVLSLGAAGCVVLTSSALGQSDPIVAVFDEPSADRWNYPFNPTPGARWTASTFGNEPGAALFDNRDGQLTLVFDTASQIPAGLGGYEVISVRLEIENASDATWRFDPTPDGWRTFLSEEDPLWLPDEDPGEPIELFGTGFRHGFDADTWQENSPFGIGDPLVPEVRSAFPIDLAEGLAADVSNSVREQFDPMPWAIGVAADVPAGEVVPYGTSVSFEVDLSRSEIAAYFAEAFDRGRLILTVASLAKVVQQGASFPGFHCKESPLVEIGVASAARLEVVVRPLPPTSSDLDGDGSVGGADLTILLAAWGKGGIADLDGDGSVGGADLAILLADWN